MKKIKVKYCKYGNTDENTPTTWNYFLHNILKKYYDVEVTENPDYVFYHDATYDYLKYDCVRIFYTSENITPNFNLADYTVSNDYLTFGDRHHRLSSYLVATFYNPKELELIDSIDITKPRTFTKEDLAKKTDFCSFVYSNYLADERRKELFDKISAYKQVNSGGRYLNNIGGPTDNKLGFEMKHKFSMAIENSCRDGYTTDRIACGFMANTIPIYWGNPKITREFNSKRFINTHEYESFDKVVERIKEIDTNDDLFIQIMNEPLFAEGYSFNIALNNFENFLRNIFDQPLEQAKRRTINMARAAEYKENELLLARHVKNRNRKKKFLAMLYKPFKKLKFLEDFKQRFFQNRLTKKIV